MKESAYGATAMAGSLSRPAVTWVFESKLRLLTVWRLQIRLSDLIDQSIPLFNGFLPGRPVC
jgi:hypothetical protein